VSFLNQLKSQASALQSAQALQQIHSTTALQQTEAAAKTAWFYLTDLVKHLNVIEPPGPSLSLNGKTPWPAMKLLDFHVDARKKKLLDQDVYDYIAIGWRIAPCDGVPVSGSVSANFPPELNRIEARLFAGAVKHERVNVRHPQKDTLQEIRFDYLTEARGSITLTADHEAAKLSFRLTNVTGFEVLNTAYPAGQIQGSVLDELAKLIVGQSSRFI
jgi:hypothetical protein